MKLQTYSDSSYCSRTNQEGAPQLSLTKYFRDRFLRVSLTMLWLGYLDVAIAKNS